MRLGARGVFESWHFSNHEDPSSERGSRSKYGMKWSFVMGDRQTEHQKQLLRHACGGLEHTSKSPACGVQLKAQWPFQVLRFFRGFRVVGEHSKCGAS